jgi:hypothetical protein
VCLTGYQLEGLRKNSVLHRCCGVERKPASSLSVNRKSPWQHYSQNPFFIKRRRVSASQRLVLSRH